MGVDVWVEVSVVTFDGAKLGARDCGDGVVMSNVCVDDSPAGERDGTCELVVDIAEQALVNCWKSGRSVERTDAP